MVTLSEVPRLIAQTIHPEQPEEPYVLKSMQKTYLGPAGEFNGRTLPCSDEDLELIREILGKPLPIQGEVMMAELRGYEQKFAQSPRRPDWVLAPLVENRKLNAEILCMNAEDSHRRALIEAIRGESLVPLDHARLPLDKSVQEALELGQISVETFRSYVAKFGISVELEPGGMADTPRVKPSGHLVEGQSDLPWIGEARRIADRIARQRFSRGEREITARNICDAVAKELQRNPEYYGERGPRTGENIRSVALRGWKFTPPTDEAGQSGSGGVG